MTTARKNRDHVHYVNNKEFSQAVVDYVTAVNTAKKNETSQPRITHYIGTCFLRISEGLSHKPNFIGYSYREEMVGDAVENCIKAVMNFRVDATTRSGLPNAFAYFTQICYFAFLRRISKEKKQQDIKFRYMEQCGASDFMNNHEYSEDMVGQENGFIDQIKKRAISNRPPKSVPEFSFTAKAESKGIEDFMS